jgi:hypothetical protein
VGAEGMNREMDWGFKPSDEMDIFTETAVKLYQQDTEWSDARQLGYRILETINTSRQLSEPFITRLTDLKVSLHQHRNNNLYGRLLQQQLFRASEYMARWIEAKNLKS